MLHGGVKKYVLLSRGVGMRNASEGNRIRKLIRGKHGQQRKYIN